MKQGFGVKWAALALVLALPLGACDDDVTGDSGRGDVTVLLTDAPGDVKSAIVTIASVYLQGDGDDGRVFLVGDADASAGIQADLVDLQNEVRELTSDKSVTAGRYSELRVVLEDACIVVEGENGADEVYATEGFTACGTADGRLQTTSTTTSGIKIKLPADGFEVNADQENTLLIDFDVSQSFGKQAGNSGQWVMSPVIRGAEVQLSGNASVSVTLGEGVTLPASVALSAFTVVLTDADGGTESMALDTNGAATFRFLIPGTYTVTLQGPAGFIVTATPDLSQTITVSSGATASAAFTLTGITTG